MREKYLLIFSHRSDCGTQPLWAWMAWYLASCLAMSLQGRPEGIGQIHVEIRTQTEHRQADLI